VYISTMVSAVLSMLLATSSKGRGIRQLQRHNALT
jgi:hypothetical protein